MKKRKTKTRIDAATAAELLSSSKPAANKEDTDKLTWNLPRPTRDERDPYGHIRTEMLDKLTRLYELHPRGTGEPGLHQNELHHAYLAKHPEFEAEYERELQRREKEGTR